MCTVWFEIENDINFEQAFCFCKYSFQDSVYLLGRVAQLQRIEINTSF